MATTLQAVPTAQIETVWRETFTSESINQRFRGLGRGVRHGFVPAIGAANDELELDVDVRVGDSVAEVGGTGGQADITIQVREPAQVSLDLTGLAAGTYYIGIRPGYATGLTTTAVYVAYTLAEVQAGTPVSEGSTLLCRVTTTGDVGVLSDVRVADDDFIRDDLALTAGRTQHGMLQQISAIDFGQGGRRISTFTVGSIAQGNRTGETGSGVLVVTPTAAAEQVVFAPTTTVVPLRQGRSALVTLRYQSNASIDGALSSVRFEEFDVAGQSLGTTSYLLADTGGDWLEVRRSFEPTDALTRYVYASFVLVSSAASPFYVDSAAFYLEKANDSTGFDPSDTYTIPSQVTLLSPDPLIRGLQFVRDWGSGQEAIFSDQGGTNSVYLQNDSTGAVAPITGAGGYPGTLIVLREGDGDFSELSEIGGANASAFTSSGAGDFFDFDDGTNVYRVWFNVEDGNSAPAVTTEVLIEVPIRAHWRSAQVVSVLAYALEGSSANVGASSSQMRFFNSGLKLDGVGVRFDATANVVFEDEFSQPSVVVENALDSGGNVATGSVEVRTGDGKGYGSWVAANTPIAHGLVRYDHGDLRFELDSPDNTSGLDTSFSTVGVGTNATRAAFTVRLDTSIPVQEEGLHVQVACSAVIGAGPSVSSQITLPMWGISYTSATEVYVNIVLIDPTSGNVVPFGASEDGVALSIAVYGRRVG